ncbi:MAG: hypothetical protein IIZ59_01785, partial [Clostridia bacterium]|nr:hypothetical protein [Clostridia bacterium]
MPKGIKACSGSWWLRSKATLYDGMSYVYGHGERIDKTGDYTTASYCIRPALQLDLSKVVFDSSKDEFTANLPHSHSFTYSASGATITATCANSDNKCDLTDHKVTLTLNKPEKTVYSDGKNPAATLPDREAFNTATGLNVASTDIKYFGRAGTSYSESSNVPTNAGKYTAKITVEGAIASVDYEIAKANSTITTVPTATGITYGQSLADSTLNGGTASVSGTFAWEDSTIEPTVSDSNNTEYTVVFTPSDTNYNTSTCNVKVTVNKAAPDIYVEPYADSITYGQTLADSSLNGRAADVDGTFAWADSMIQPAVSDSNNTEYAVTFTPDDTDNYTSATCNVTIEVNKALPTYVTPENLTAVCGTNVGDIDLPEGFTWDNPNETVMFIGTYFFYATYTPDDTDNYVTLEFIPIEVTGTGIHHEEIPATCEENGVVEYWEDGLGNKFSDENGTEPLADEETIIEKLGHSFIHFLKWVWNGFNRVIAWIFCDNDPDHIETIDVPFVIETYDAPTCTEE